MIYLIYDGSFHGFLSAVFDVYDLKLKNVKFIKKNLSTPELFAQVINTQFNENQYKRVYVKLKEYLGSGGIYDLWRLTLSELNEVEEILWGVIQYTFHQKKNILKDYGNLHVLQLQNILKKINRERHRMKAFVRFKLAQDGIFYATVEPDFDVLPLVAQHFKNRYADQKWLILDTQRNYGIYYDLNQVITVEIREKLNRNTPSLLEIEWDETEENFQSLWKNYFKSKIFL